MRDWGMPSRQYQTDDQTPTGPSSPTRQTGNNSPFRLGPLSFGNGTVGLGPFQFGGGFQTGGLENFKPGPTSAGAPPPTRTEAQAGQAPSAGGGFQGVKKKSWTPADWEEAINAFFTRMNKGLDFNDPRTQAILNNARNSTMQSVNDHGIYGGYSENAAEGSYIKAASGLQSQQDAMALQALGMGSGFSRGLANDAYGRAMDAYGKGEEEAGGWGAGIGGGLGALGGGVAGFFAGGPAGIAPGVSAGWNFGSNLGAGIGKSGYDANNPKPTYGGY